MSIKAQDLSYMSKLPDFFQSSNDNTLLSQLDFELGGLDEDEELPIEEEIETDVFNDSNIDTNHLPTFFNDEDSQNEDIFELSTSLLSTSININSNNNINNVPKSETPMTSIELLKATLMKPSQTQPNPPPPAASQSFTFTSNTHISPAVNNKPPGLFTQHAPPPIPQPVQQPNYIPLQTGSRPPNATNNQPQLSFMSGPTPPPPSPQPSQPTSSQGASQPLPTFAPPRGILMSASNVRYRTYLKICA